MSKGFGDITICISLDKEALNKMNEQLNEIELRLIRINWLFQSLSQIDLKNLEVPYASGSADVGPGWKT